MVHNRWSMQVAHFDKCLEGDMIDLSTTMESNTS